MATRSMTKRNLIWLATIIVVFGVVWVIAGAVPALIAAAATLVVSEVVERRARARRRVAHGQPAARSVGDVLRSR